MQAVGARGFTLLEILVALLVLALGITGGVAMQLAAQRTRHQSALLTQSLQMATGLAEHIRANGGIARLPAGANPYLALDYDALAEPNPLPPDPLCYALGAACDSAQLAQFDLYELKAQVLGGLPAGRARVCRDAGVWRGGRLRWRCSGGADAPLVIKVGWRGKRPDGTPLRDDEAEFAPGVAVVLGALP